MDLFQVFRDLGRLDDAEAACRRLTDARPQSAQGWRGLAQVARLRGDRRRSLEYGRKAQACDPGVVSAAIEVANDLRELGRFEEAEAVAAANCDAFPQSAQALIGYANALRHKASNTKPLQLLEQATRLEPGHPGARMALADEYLIRWRLDEAEALYDQALSANAGFVAALTGKGQVCRRRGDRRGALKYFARAAEIDKNSERTTLEHARELIEAGSAAEGLKRLEDAVADRPHWRQCRILIAQTQRESGDYAAARKSLEGAREGAVKDYAWTELAADDFRLGDVRAATQALRDALADRPAFVTPLVTLAAFAQAFDGLEGALALLRRARAIDATQPSLLIRIAVLQAYLGRLEESQASFREIDESFGPLPDARAARAALLREQGEYTASLQTLEQAAAQFPTHFGIWSALVMARIHAGQFPAVERMLQAPPAAVARERGRVYVLRTQLALAQWRIEEAAVELEKALALLPAETYVHRLAANCALLRLDVEEARQRLDSTTDRNPSHRALHNGGLKPMQTQEGQMIDEYRLDPSALERLKAASRGPDPVRDLAALVREAGDYTPAAIAFLVALRRQGRLDPAHGRAALQIPRKIAQFWDHDIPDDVAKLCGGWREAHPDFTHTLFCAVAARRFLTEKGALDALTAFDAATAPAMKADIFRLAYLYFEGGFYIDSDDRCLARLDELDHGGARLLLYQELYGTVGNNFIGAEAGSPVIGGALRQAAEAINRGDADFLWLATGPGLLTRAFAHHLAEDVAQRLPAVRVLERHELARALATHCRTSYKYTRKHWSRTLQATEGRTAAALRAAVEEFAGEYL